MAMREQRSGPTFIFQVEKAERWRDLLKARLANNQTLSSVPGYQLPKYPAIFPLQWPFIFHRLNVATARL